MRTDYPDWFSMVAKDNFAKYLDEFKGKPNLKFLQIGAFTGNATVWLMENILTDKSSALIDIDTWEGSDEEDHKQYDFSEVRAYYLTRTRGYNNLKPICGMSQDHMPYFVGDEFNFAYIDGDHTTPVVRQDAEEAFRLVKSGGIIAFDDYGWGAGLDPQLTPKPAIDEFLEKYSDKLDILEKSYQVWVRKK